MKKVILFLACIHCYTACNNETVIPADPQETPRQPLELFMPGAETVSVYSTATVSECMIDTLWVLVFQGNTKRWVEKIEGSRVMNNGQATQLLPQLKHKIDNGNTVICIANVAPNPDTTSVTPDRINACFKPKQGFYCGGDFLPMYGEIKSWSPAGAYTCRMIRAVAKIQVQLGPSFAYTPVRLYFSDFSPNDVKYKIYHFPDSGFVQPKSTLAGIPGKSSSITPIFNFLQKDDATEAQTNAYIYEFQSSIHTIGDTVTLIDKKKWHVSRPFILLTRDIPLQMLPQYYRLDFYNSADSEFLDIKRNHHYLFTINKVRSEGYISEYTAITNTGSNIEYTIRVDDGQYITSNGQYAVVTSVDTVRISGDVTNQTVATFRFINPSGQMINYIDSDTGGTQGLNEISVEVTTVKPNGATLSITSPEELVNAFVITGTKRELKITTTGGLTEGVIRFKLGNITHRLPVKKI
jgi:hypothetical protein